MNEHNSFPVVSEGQIGAGTVQTVNARELHAFLDVGVRFNDWIARRVEEYSFTEGRDFYSEMSKTSSGGRPSREYHISIDMAKELSMVERNDQGKRARQYFIECERQAKQTTVFDPSTILESPAAMRGLLLTYTEKVIALEGRVAELQPSHDALERIALSDGSLCITDAAKALQMRPKDLFEWLRHNGWIYRRPNTGHDLGYQSKTASGLLEHKVTTVLRADGSEKVTEQVRVTPKGLTKLASLIKRAIGRAA